MTELITPNENEGPPPVPAAVKVAYLLLTIGSVGIALTAFGVLRSLRDAPSWVVWNGAVPMLDWASKRIGAEVSVRVLACGCAFLVLVSVTMAVLGGVDLRLDRWSYRRMVGWGIFVSVLGGSAVTLARRLGGDRQVGVRSGWAADSSRRDRADGLGDALGRHRAGHIPSALGGITAVARGATLLGTAILAIFVCGCRATFEPRPQVPGNVDHLRASGLDGRVSLATAPVGRNAEMGVWAVDPADDKPPRLLLSEHGITRLTWSQVAKAVVYVTESGGSEELRVAEIGSESGVISPRTIDTAPGIGSVAVSQRTAQIAYERYASRHGAVADIFPDEVVVFDLRNGKREVRKWPDHHVTKTLFSPIDDSVMVLARSGGHSVLGRLYGGERPPEQLFESNGNSIPEAWSPSGVMVAGEFVDQTASENRPQETRIFVYDLQRRQYRLFGEKGGTTIGASWSADGKQLAFASGVPSPLAIFRLNMATGEMRLIHRGNQDEMGPAWSPDGRQIAFLRLGNGGARICIVNADGSNFQELQNQPVGIQAAVHWVMIGQ